MIKAVLIDVDDTLLDFHAYVREALKSGFAEFGLGEYTANTYEVFTKVNNQMWRDLEDKKITFQELMATRFSNVFDALGVECDGPAFEKYFRGRLFYSAIHVDGAMEMLEYLHGKYILCAASNGPYEQQMHRLEIGGIAEKMSHFFISEKMGVSKPSKEYFDICIRELNEDGEILPEEIMIIGDSLTSDMAGGIGSGIKTCFFDRKCTGDTKGLNIDYVVCDLRDVRKFL